MKSEIFKDIDKRLLDQWWAFHRRNPGVFKSFRDNALRMKACGRKRYSAWAIINKVRWDYDLKTEGDEFKINNNHIALYARYMIHKHPEFKGFFNLRGMKLKKQFTWLFD